MLSGLRDALNGAEPQVDVQAMMPKAAEIFKARQAEANAEQNADQIAFLETAAAEEGAVQTESGLVIKETSAGSGASPSASDSVEVHYEGKLIDGTVFDSSIARGTPISFPCEPRPASQPPPPLLPLSSALELTDSRCCAAG